MTFHVSDIYFFQIYIFVYSSNSYVYSNVNALTYFFLLFFISFIYLFYVFFFFFLRLYTNFCLYIFILAFVCIYICIYIVFTYPVRLYFLISSPYSIVHSRPAFILFIGEFTPHFTFGATSVNPVHKQLSCNHSVSCSCLCYSRYFQYVNPLFIFIITQITWQLFHLYNFITTINFIVIIIQLFAIQYRQI